MELVQLCQRGEWGKFPERLWYERKLDGTRCKAHKENGRIRLINRRGYGYTEQFPEIVEALKQIPYDFIIDGEICSDNFTSLAGRAHLQDPFKIRLRAKLKPCDFFVFDVLKLDGRELHREPLRARKQALKEFPASPRIILLMPEPLPILLTLVEAKEIEGVVGKDPEAPYEFRRSPTWVKFRKRTTDDLVVIGYEDSDKPTRPFRSLIMRRGGKEVQASSGLSEADLKRLDRIFAGEPKRKVGTKWYFDNPRFIVEVEFYGGSEIAWRFPVVKRLRLDKEKAEV